MSAKTLICIIRSRVHERPDAEKFLEGGFYELKVYVSMVQAAGTGDAKGFVKSQIAQHLAGCVKHSGIPLNEGMWLIEFSPFAIKHLGFPKGATV